MSLNTRLHAGFVLLFLICQAVLIVGCGAGGHEITSGPASAAAPSSSAAPKAVFSVSSLSFTDTLVGVAATQSLTLSNPGDAMLDITSIALAGQNASSFAQSNNCGVIITPGSSCTINLTFKPNAKAVFAGLLSVGDDAGNSPQAVSLTGNGVVSSGALLTPGAVLSSSDLFFSAVETGKSSPVQNLTLSNHGDAILDISNITIIGTDKASFKETNTCDGTLAPTSSCVISVTFVPASASVFQASLSISDNSNASPQLVPMTGTGITPTAPPASGIVPSGLLADYMLTDGAGSTVATDMSGNSAPAVLGVGAAAPVWTATGLNFTRSSTLTLPNTLANNVRTIQIFADFIPMYPTDTVLTWEIIHTPNVPGEHGFQWSGYINRVSGATASPYRVMTFETTSNGSSAITQGLDTVEGNHLLTSTLGCSSDNTKDRLYIDAAEVSDYRYQGASCNQQSPGRSLVIGGPSYRGNVYAILFYNRILTPAEVKQNHDFLASELTARGVSFSVPINPSSSNQLVVDGDSITQGFKSRTGPWTNALILDEPFVITNNAISGSTVYEMLGSAQYHIDQYYAPNAKYNIAILAGGTNDLHGDGFTPEATYARILSWCAGRRARGFKTIVTTIPSMGGTTNGVSNDELRDELNTLLRSPTTMQTCDALADVASDPELGADGAYLYSPPFAGDQLHISDESRLSAIQSNAINALTGSTLDAPNQTIITASEYHSVAADGAVQFDTRINSIDDYLVPSIGFTGRKIYACNVSASGMNHLTLHTATGEYINTSGQTTLLVPAGKCQALTATIVSASTGGTYWATAN